jgi:hypothetical protein
LQDAPQKRRRRRWGDIQNLEGLLESWLKVAGETAIE